MVFWETNPTILNFITQQISWNFNVIHLKTFPKLSRENFKSIFRRFLFTSLNTRVINRKYYPQKNDNHSIRRLWKLFHSTTEKKSIFILIFIITSTIYLPSACWGTKKRKITSFKTNNDNNKTKILWRRQPCHTPNSAILKSRNFYVSCSVSSHF